MHSARDVQTFHRQLLPGLLAGRQDLGAKAARGLDPVTFDFGQGVSYTYGPTDQGIEVSLATQERSGTLVSLTPQAWSDLVAERLTLFGLLYTGRLTFLRGQFEDLAGWEAPLRALFAGRPVFDPDERLVARDGTPLGLGGSFTLDDEDDDVRHFLRTAGYAHIREVFSGQEIEALRGEVARLAAQATPGDYRSWWTSTDGGNQVLCRLTYAGRSSSLIASQVADARIRRLVALAGEEVQPVSDRMDGEQVVIKVPRASEGLADLPWHVDCGLGMHPVLCPCILIGIQLDDANEEAGQLHFLAGSRERTCPPSLSLESEDKAVALSTRAGDCTIHFGDTLHAAPGPTGRSGRRTLYLQYYAPGVFEKIPPGKGTNDVLAGHADGRIRSVQEIT